MIAMMMEASAFTGLVNLGNPLETAGLDLAEKIIQTTASKSKIVFKPLPQDNPARRVPLDAGLSRTIEYLQ